jgi:hypothetical protein
MFSQLRQAVENFAPQPRRGSVDDELIQEHQGSRLSSAQLADSALSNLRKSLTSQRSGSPRSNSPHPRSPVPSSLPRSTSLPDQESRLLKSNLDDRLRAKFAIGDVSNGTTPEGSGRASPAAVVVHQRPASPPLTQSPQPQESTETIVTGNVTITEPHPLLNVEDKELPDSVTERYPEADIPLPPDSPPQSLEADRSNVSSPFDANVSETDVEALQQRLKLVEQRFTGKLNLCARNALLMCLQMYLCRSRGFRPKKWLLTLLSVSSPLWMASQIREACVTTYRILC